MWSEERGAVGGGGGKGTKQPLPSQTKSFCGDQGVDFFERNTITY